MRGCAALDIASASLPGAWTHRDSRSRPAASEGGFPSAGRCRHGPTTDQAAHPRESPTSASFNCRVHLGLDPPRTGLRRLRHKTARPGNPPVVRRRHSGYVFARFAISYRRFWRFGFFAVQSASHASRTAPPYARQISPVASRRQTAADSTNCPYGARRRRRIRQRSATSALIRWFQRRSLARRR